MIKRVQIDLENHHKCSVHQVEDSGKDHQKIIRIIGPVLLHYRINDPIMISTVATEGHSFREGQAADKDTNETL